jgi:hypothetical protein
MTGVLLLYFTGYVLWSGVRLVPVTAATGGSGTVTADRGGTAGAVRWGDRPELSRACRLSMAIGMLAMLLMM